ncbi:MAG: ABC transporter ATP-binding protein [Chloroflexi bacterium HGW-Chloroflexi-10]|nr:MAG: ABC transporter ATP-binding protein [Chloroflexi bacterium HGW-Chloroflexi-10]
MQPSIELQNVSKKYRIGKASLNLRALLQFKKNQAQYHWAVKDINFKLNPGESLGIIGPNGAGKTTILKLLSKVTFPTSGTIQMNGRFSALIELGAGFHPELTGRENVYLNGTILGMRRDEINRRFDQIVEFAGIEKYLDTPVKRYSSGMYARLGFSVAAHVDPEIMLVDEVLAVGDMAFQKKCYEHMLNMIQNGTTLILVSHNMRAVQKVCQRSIVMYRGQPAFEGSAADATAEYSNILRQAAAEYQPTDADGIQDGIGQRIMTHEAVIESIKMVRSDGSQAYTFSSGEIVKLRAEIAFKADVRSPIAACTVRTPEGQVVFDFTTDWAGIQTPDFSANTRTIMEFNLNLNLAPGTYQIGVNLAYHDLSRYYDRIDRAFDFVMTSVNGSRGITDLQANIEFHPEEMTVVH